MGIRHILLLNWMLPVLAIAALLYNEYAVPASPPPETNRAMRERMCQEHVDLARTDPGDDAVKTAVAECLGSGYITHAEGITAID